MASCATLTPAVAMSIGLRFARSSGVMWPQRLP